MHGSMEHSIVRFMSLTLSSLVGLSAKLATSLSPRVPRSRAILDYMNNIVHMFVTSKYKGKRYRCFSEHMVHEYGTANAFRDRS